MELRYIGGTYAGKIKPAPFLCLVLKMLKIQPEKDIIVEFIKNEDFKYVVHYYSLSLSLSLSLSPSLSLSLPLSLPLPLPRL